MRVCRGVCVCARACAPLRACVRLCALQGGACVCVCPAVRVHARVPRSARDPEGVLAG